MIRPIYPTWTFSFWQVFRCIYTFNPLKRCLGYDLHAFQTSIYSSTFRAGVSPLSTFYRFYFVIYVDSVRISNKATHRLAVRASHFLYIMDNSWTMYKMILKKSQSPVQCRFSYFSFSPNRSIQFKLIVCLFYSPQTFMIRFGCRNNNRFSTIVLPFQWVKVLLELVESVFLRIFFIACIFFSPNLHIVLGS